MRRVGLLIAVGLIVLVAVFALTSGAFRSIGSATVASPPAPKVGDSCTNNGGSFTYNDGGPGFVEQTALGLVCQ